MQTNTGDNSKATFTLERAEEDDEFEEFERDGIARSFIMIIRLE